jgi:ATP-dependent DNA helicase RecG
MTNEELNIILSRGENSRTEFKEARISLPSEVFQTVVSFLNHEGGTIIFGANDLGEITGIDPLWVEKIKKDLVTALNNKEVINPPVKFPVYHLISDMNQVLCLKIPVSSQVHTYKGVIYSRVNDSDISITDDARISEIYFNKRNTFTESEIIKHLRYEDFEPNLFEKTRSIVSAINSTHPWIEATDMTILRDSQFYRRDPRTGEEGFTLAAALVFGRDNVIQSLLPGYKVDVLVRVHDTDRFDDRMRPIRTNLIDTYQVIMEFLKTKPWLPEKFFIEGDQRKDLRELIFRELVGNMIVHREYTSAHPSELIIYDGRVEISNPNRPLFRGILPLDGFSPYAKNPSIRKFFAEFGWTDELGSGIKNVKKYLKFYANGAKPVFIEDDKFCTVIPLINPVFGERAEMVIQFSGLNTDILPDELMVEMQKLALFPPLAKISDPDAFLFQKGSSWAEKGVKLKNARINKINKLQFGDFQKGSSWAEKGVKLLPKRTLAILKVLIICLVPVKIEEIKQNLIFGSRDKLRELYLNPLRKEGMIEITVRDKPNSPDQRYVLTEKGKLFLGGFEII